MRAVCIVTLASLLPAALLQPATARATVVICQKGRTLRLRRDGCKKKETPVDASELGVTGPAGTPGNEGEQGPPGSPGEQGPAGPSGTATANAIFTAFCPLETTCECPASGHLLSGGVFCEEGVVKQSIAVNKTLFAGMCDTGLTNLGVTCLGRPCETAADCPGKGVCDGETKVCQCEDDATGSDCISIRLVPGPFEGRLEVFHDGVWGTVCDDGWEDAGEIPSAQGQLNAAVACKQLALGAPTKIQVAGEVASQLAAQPTWIDDTACAGSESTLTACPFAGFGTENCSHGEDVGLTCAPAP